MKGIYGVSVAIFCPLWLFFAISCALLQAQSWPPTRDVTCDVKHSVDGRRLIERYVHGEKESWGYPASAHSEWLYSHALETGAGEQNHNSFYVVHPTQAHTNGPLLVVLHSANRTAYDYMGYTALDRKVAADDDPETAMTNVPDNFYGLYLNSTNSEWWGWSAAHENELNGKYEAPPAERRVLDTIEWIVQQYHIDPNRIYLTGVSMGGNGALGIGMPHGDIFAAILVTVPAGTNYLSYRMGGLAPSPDIDSSDEMRRAWKRKVAVRQLPDPPVLVDFSSPLDAWSMTQPALLAAAKAGHLPLILSWGPFGHTTFGSAIAKNETGKIALKFPWLDIRRNEAYPVFTHASSDQQSPWLNTPSEFDPSGQINAYFRWRSLDDSAQRFRMELWIADDLAPADEAVIPEQSTVDISLRRLQQFKVSPGQKFRWRYEENGRPMASGSVLPDASDLLTIPRLALAKKHGILLVEPEN